jgi:hypothetical protein
MNVSDLFPNGTFDTAIALDTVQEIDSSVDQDKFRSWFNRLADMQEEIITASALVVPTIVLEILLEYRDIMNLLQARMAQAVTSPKPQTINYITTASSSIDGGRANSTFDDTIDGGQVSSIFSGNVDGGHADPAEFVSSSGTASVYTLGAGTVILAEPLDLSKWMFDTLALYGYTKVTRFALSVVEPDLIESLATVGGYTLANLIVEKSLEYFRNLNLRQEIFDFQVVASRNIGHWMTSDTQSGIFERSQASSAIWWAIKNKETYLGIQEAGYKPYNEPVGTLEAILPTTEIIPIGSKNLIPDGDLANWTGSSSVVLSSYVSPLSGETLYNVNSSVVTNQRSISVSTLSEGVHTASVLVKFNQTNHTMGLRLEFDVAGQTTKHLAGIQLFNDGTFDSLLTDTTRADYGVQQIETDVYRVWVAFYYAANYTGLTFSVRAAETFTSTGAVAPTIGDAMLTATNGLLIYIAAGQSQILYETFSRNLLALGSGAYVSGYGLVIPGTGTVSNLPERTPLYSLALCNGYSTFLVNQDGREVKDGVVSSFPSIDIRQGLYTGLATYYAEFPVNMSIPEMIEKSFEINAIYRLSALRSPSKYDLQLIPSNVTLPDEDQTPG